MILFYDELSGTHNVTEEWIVLSLSMVLVSNTGEVITEEHVKNPFIWGGPSLLYTTINGAHGHAEYFDWEAPINEAVVRMLNKAVEHIDNNPNDQDIKIITWNGFDYMPSSLSDIEVGKVSHLLNRPNSSLLDIAIENSLPMATLDSDERIKAIQYLYNKTIKKLT